MGMRAVLKSSSHAASSLLPGELIIKLSEIGLD